MTTWQWSLPDKVLEIDDWRVREDVQRAVRVGEAFVGAAGRGSGSALVARMWLTDIARLLQRNEAGPALDRVRGDLLPRVRAAVAGLDPASARQALAAVLQALATEINDPFETPLAELRARSAGTPPEERPLRFVTPAERLAPADPGARGM